MTFATQLRSLSEAVAQGDAARLALQDELRKEASRKRRGYRRKAAPAGPSAPETRDAPILRALKGGGLLSSSKLGAAAGCGRMAAYQRLKVLEAQGQVQMVGQGVKTKWRLP